MIVRGTKSVILRESSGSINLSELAELIKDVPKECIDSLVIECDTRTEAYSDYTSAYLIISYTREETDEEFEARKKRIEHDLKAQKQRELALLKQLQNKYRDQL